MADDECSGKVCQCSPCRCLVVASDVEWLLIHPREDLRGIYHEPQESWLLINALRRRVLATAAAERKRCADFVRSYGTCGSDSPVCQTLADELERLA